MKPSTKCPAGSTAKENVTIFRGKNMRMAIGSIVLLMILGVAARGDGPADNLVANVRPIPPTPKAMTPGDKADVEAGVASLEKEIAALRKELAGKPELLALLPDVEI